MLDRLSVCETWNVRMRMCVMCISRWCEKNKLWIFQNKFGCLLSCSVSLCLCECVSFAAAAAATIVATATYLLWKSVSCNAHIHTHTRKQYIFVCWHQRKLDYCYLRKSHIHVLLCKGKSKRTKRDWLSKVKVSMWSAQIVFIRQTEETYQQADEQPKSSAKTKIGFYLWCCWWLWW